MKKTLMLFSATFMISGAAHSEQIKEYKTFLSIGFALCHSGDKPEMVRDFNLMNETKEEACRRHGFEPGIPPMKKLRVITPRSKMMITNHYSYKKLAPILSPLAFEKRVLSGDIDHILFADITTKERILLSEVIGSDTNVGMGHSMGYVDLINAVLQKLRHSSESDSAKIEGIDEDLKKKIQDIEEHLGATTP